MQDTKKTLEIYNQALYPTMSEFGIDELVEDNVSPHNNQTIHDSHDVHNVRIVGYEVTPAEKDQIITLIEKQTQHTTLQTTTGPGGQYLPSPSFITLILAPSPPSLSPSRSPHISPSPSPSSSSSPSPSPSSSPPLPPFNLALSITPAGPDDETDSGDGEVAGVAAELAGPEPDRRSGLLVVDGEVDPRFGR